MRRYLTAACVVVAAVVVALSTACKGGLTPDEARARGGEPTLLGSSTSSRGFEAKLCSDYAVVLCGDRTELYQYWSRDMAPKLVIPRDPTCDVAPLYSAGSAYLCAANVTCVSVYGLPGGGAIDWLYAPGYIYGVCAEDAGARLGGFANYPVVYAVTQDSGLYVFGGATVSEMSLIARCRVPSYLWRVETFYGYTTEKQYLAVAGSRLLYVVDISDPRAPVSVASVDLPGGLTEMRVDFPYVYLACGSFCILDVTDPQSPVFASQLEVPAGAAGLDVVAQSRALIACGDSGVVMYDVNDPSAPVRISSWLVPGGSYGVAYTSMDAWVAGDSGLYLLRYPW